ncbi:MAG: L-histidine N(alpha)-methyltransferase [Planctomycetes bacterium]|nr:L-histidine N(alpha)-methyltransferase [Planctomycetota bacterium]
MQLLNQSERFRLMGGPAPDMQAEFAADVLQGLSQPQKSLPCRHIYDAQGSRLFEEICALPEYYLTRAEAEILTQHSPAILAHMGQGFELVELGSGSAEKTRLLIAAALQSQTELHYRPIDISRDAIATSAVDLLADFPGLHIDGYASDYVTALHDLSASTDAKAGPRLILWLGSSVGNFDRPGAADFLRLLRAELRPCDALLLGADLRKQKPTLDAAYDDAAGTTARFNKNLLVRINNELGGNFPIEAFRYQANYEVDTGRVKMSLISTEACSVHIEQLDQDFSFEANEAIETEDSYKYSLAEIDTLAEASGFRVVDQWLDSRQRFSTSLLKGNGQY